MSGDRETTIQCPRCLQRVTYCKVNFVVNGFYPDWRLDVWCGCGDVTDPIILRQVREFYGEEIGREINAMHEAALIQRIGQRTNDWLSSLSFFEVKYGGRNRNPADQRDSV